MKKVNLKYSKNKAPITYGVKQSLFTNDGRFLQNDTTSEMYRLRSTMGMYMVENTMVIRTHILPGRGTHVQLGYASCFAMISLQAVY